MISGRLRVAFPFVAAVFIWQRRYLICSLLLLHHGLIQFQIAFLLLEFETSSCF